MAAHHLSCSVGAEFNKPFRMQEIREKQMIKGLCSSCILFAMHGNFKHKNLFWITLEHAGTNP